MIPPDDATILALFVTLALAAVVYKLTRRYSSRAEVALVGLAPFAVLALIIEQTEPQTAYLPLWPALFGSAA